MNYLIEKAYPASDPINNTSFKLIELYSTKLIRSLITAKDTEKWKYECLARNICFLKTFLKHSKNE